MAAFSGQLAELFVDIKTRTADYESGLSRIKGTLSKLGLAVGVAFGVKKILLENVTELNSISYF